MLNDKLSDSAPATYNIDTQVEKYDILWKNIIGKMMNLAAQLLNNFNSLRVVGKLLALRSSIDKIHTRIATVGVLIFALLFGTDIYLSLPFLHTWEVFASIAYCLSSGFIIFFGTALLSSYGIKKLLRKFSVKFKTQEHEYDRLFEEFNTLLEEDETFKHELYAWVEQAANTLHQESIKDNREYGPFNKVFFIKSLLNKDMLSILNIINGYHNGLKKVQSYYEEPDKIKEFTKMQEKYQQSVQKTSTVNIQYSQVNEQPEYMEEEIQAGEFKKYL